MNLPNIRNIYLVGDTHFGIRNNSIEWSTIQREFFLNFLLKKIDEDFNEDTDILIFEGDIFHYREAVNVRIQNEVFDTFTILAKKFKRGVFAITGNHDTYYKDNGEVHSLRAIGNLAENIHIFEKPEVLTLNGKFSFLMIPWIEDTQKMISVLEDHQSFCKYVICHSDIKGFKFNKWVSIEKGLDLENLSKYKKIYSGHIHIRQEKENVLYTGSPYQMDRGDIGNVKGFYKLTLTDEGINEKFVKNTYSPLFLKFDIMDLLEMPVSAIISQFKNNFVDVMINVKFANKFSVPKFLEELSKSTHRKIEFFTYNDQDKITEPTNSEFNIEDGFNLTDFFKMYVKGKDYSTELKKKLAVKFMDIHNDVKQNKSYA